MFEAGFQAQLAFLADAGAVGIDLGALPLGRVEREIRRQPRA